MRNHLGQFELGHFDLFAFMIHPAEARRRSSTNSHSIMQTYQGILRELGQSVANLNGARYTYIEIGDQMVKKVGVLSGLDSKLNNALGKSITLHVNGDMMVAITTEDGKTYAIEKRGFFGKCVGWVFILIGVAFAIFANGLFAAVFCSFWFLMGAYKLYKIAQLNSGAALPNAIQI